MKDIKKELERKKQIEPDKKAFKEPKLTFIEPKLTKQGDATKITGQPPFFQSFIP
ncbi:hypothetical protein K8R42_01550 [bacterium]|nr:hypothetical protein [bacterium]